MPRRDQNPVFWLPAFKHFIKLVKVPSKELEEPAAITLYRAQSYFLDKLIEGLENDIHFFVILKARQLGLSTIAALFDLFWLYIHPGLQGAFIMDTAENKEVFRETIEQMLDSLPSSYKIPTKAHNRTSLVLTNRSRLQYMSAGVQKNSRLGRSRGLNFVHGSEAAFWGDPEGFEALLRSLSEVNPNRLYIFESTAHGFNHFEELYKEAKVATDRMAIFIGWWAKDSYTIEEGTREFDFWWGSRPFLTEEEQERAGQIKESYGWELTTEQVAWYRKQEHDTSAEMLRQELPSTEFEAFVATGSKFFNARRVTEDINVIRNSGQVTFRAYRYDLGQTYTSTRVIETQTLDDLDLRVWEEPRKGAKYVIGCDPNQGSATNGDRCAISVWRCYADRLVQVAEYATAKPESQQCAWVLAHLAGSYRDCIVNIEVFGPGYAVMQEMNSLRQQLRMGQIQIAAAEAKITDSLDNMRWYLYHRPDSMGVGFAYGWKSSQENKLRLYNVFRDKYNLGMLVPRSAGLLEEMITLVQDGDYIAASGRNKDDRPMAAGLACMAWDEWVRPGMLANNLTYDRVRQTEATEAARGQEVVSWIVSKHFEAKEAESAAAQRALLERW